MPKRLYIKTFGCQMNVYDSLKMAAVLKPLDFQPTQKASEADMILVNTCSIREKAVHKLHSILGGYRKIKRERGNVLLGVAGCVAQQEKQALLKRFPYVDLVIGPDNIKELPDLVEQLHADNTQALSRTELFDGLEGFAPDIESDLIQGSTAFITIMKGCNKKCTYCIVPYVRGREFSRPSQEIISEIKYMVTKGVKEITLLGQNVNAYRYDGVKLAQLIEMVSEIPDIKRIRFTTSHPQNLTKDLIQSFSTQEKLCKQLHLPVQSGSDKVLKDMLRTYTQAWFLRKVELLRQACPDIALSTDIIVGFAGETEKDHQQTLDLLNKVQFDAIYAFKYSPRKYTTAFAMQDDVSEEEKDRRLQEVLNLQRQITWDKNRQQLGKDEEVLVEGYGKNSTDRLYGRTSANRLVHFQSSESLIGQIVRVSIDHAGANSLGGSMHA